jgi:hypothetical protein
VDCSLSRYTQARACHERKDVLNVAEPAKDLIRKYSGEWTAARFIESYDRSDELAMEQLKSDPKRNLVFPSLSDLDLAQSVFKSVIADWLENKPRQQEVLWRPSGTGQAAQNGTTEGSTTAL